MTELQPTEIEFKKKGKAAGASNRGKILAFIALAVLLAAVAGLTALLAHRASTDPVILEPTTLPADDAGRK